MITMLSQRPTLPAVAVALICLLTAGCGSRVTKANADRINTGMTESEVSAILGPATESAEAKMPQLPAMPGAGSLPITMPTEAKQSVWKDGDRAIVVTFVDGKATAKVTSGL